MNRYKFTITVNLDDNSGDVDQYIELRDTLVHLLKREDEAGNLIDKIKDFSVDTESIYLTRLFNTQEAYFEALKAGKSEEEATRISKISTNFGRKSVSQSITPEGSEDENN